MPNFLILIDEICNYSKKDVDIGHTPAKIYRICSIIRECFCLSYAIRKNNNLFLYFFKNLVIIKFSGKKLRFLSSDERSQAILLEKSLNKLNEPLSGKNKDWIESTPGIFIKKFENENSFIFYLNNLNLNQIIFVFNSIHPTHLPFLMHVFDYPKIKKFKNINNLEDSLFIISVNHFEKKLLLELLKLIASLFPSTLKNITLTTIKKIKAPEDKILYINFQCDVRT
ncbi:MAG: hypothetical protein ACTSQJ_08955 [Promethearchaeota archaeon]